MQPLLEALEYSPTGGDEPVEQLLEILWDSGELAEEPELAEIFADPTLAMTTYISAAQESGIAEPEMLDQLPEEEQEDKKYEILEKTTRQLLDNELRQEVIYGLNKLRLRLKRVGKQAEAAKAAALQSFLSEHKARELWPALGLPQAIVLRSVGAGFELMDASLEVAEVEGFDEESPEVFYQRVAESGLVDKMSQAIQKVPGLSRFLEKQVDQVWEEGNTAIFEGELYLELFTPEEIEAGLDIFESSLKDNWADSGDETSSQETERPELTKEKGTSLISRLDAYLTERFTPERLGQLRAHLDTVVKGAKFSKNWLPFVLMIREHMADEEALEYEKGFLLRSFLGEMRYVSVNLEEEEEE
jgi:hypothetical protein